MCKNECLLGYLEVLRQTLENYGIPISIYPDKYSVFFPPKKVDDHLTIEEQLNGREKGVTQFWIYVKFLDTFFENFFIFMRPLSSLYYILNLYWYKWYTELLTFL